MSRRDNSNPILNAGISGALTGGTLAGLSALNTPKLDKAAILKAVLTGGATFGGLGAGSTALGLGLMGRPKDDEQSGYTKRGGIGGLLGGGVLGGALGGLAGMGKIGIPEKTPLWLAEYANKLKGMKGAPLIGAGLGALGLGATAGYLGSDEGMQLDVIENELRDKRKRELLNG